MKLIALLNWYDEPTWFLIELIASLKEAGCDHLVALDGAYLAYPNGRAQSPGQQSQAILAAAQGAGMGCLIYTPQDLWMGNEVEKRTALFAAGHLIAEPGDWFWVADGDEVVTEAIGVRECLEQTEHEAGQVLIEGLFYGSREGQFALRKLFKYQETGIQVVNNHFTYVSGEKLLYEGFCAPKPQLVDAETMHFVRIDHRSGRSQDRELAAQQFYDRRKEQGLELVPG